MPRPTTGCLHVLTESYSCSAALLLLLIEESPAHDHHPWLGKLDVRRVEHAINLALAFAQCAWSKSSLADDPGFSADSSIAPIFSSARRANISPDSANRRDQPPLVGVDDGQHVGQMLLLKVAANRAEFWLGVVYLTPSSIVKASTPYRTVRISSLAVNLSSARLLSSHHTPAEAPAGADVHQRVGLHRIDHLVDREIKPSRRAAGPVHPAAGAQLVIQIGIREEEIIAEDGLRQRGQRPLSLGIKQGQRRLGLPDRQRRFRLYICRPRAG
jgi:hypothetical protein